MNANRTESIKELLCSVAENDPTFPTDVDELVEPNAAAAEIVGEGVRSRARLVLDVVNCIRANGLQAKKPSRVRLSGALRPLASKSRETAHFVEVVAAIVRHAPQAPRPQRVVATRAASSFHPNRRRDDDGRAVGGVRAFLSVFTFPSDPCSLRLEPDEHGLFETPLDQVLAGPSNWSAPRYAEAGDVCFFYYSKRSRQNVKRVRRLLEREGRLHRRLRQFIDRAELQAEQYAGRLVAYSFVLAKAHRDDRLSSEDYDWGNRILAPMGSVYVLQQSLDLMRFRDTLPFPHGQTIVPLQPSEFVRLMEALRSEGNDLDPRLQRALPVSVSRELITSQNWRKVACSKAHRFLNEQEVRGDFIDYFLDELRDLRTTVAREVDCRTAGRVLGRVDYVVRLRGHAVPVEAKLNVRAERDLPRQMRQYLEAEEFVAWRMGRPATLRTPWSKLGIVVDVAGLYVLNEGGFVGCTSDSPVIRRLEIGGLSRPVLRARIAGALQLLGT